ncbi:hypothetical protein DH09_00540 (plasmid) [Bacillaceae bacterium JMAK1]|nr:hypothetical protein DH09_00540 [Bacillaceae bacterium JMAK1]
MGMILMLLVFAFLGFLYWKASKSEKQDEQTVKPDEGQTLLEFLTGDVDHIYDNGIIQLKDQTFACMMEVGATTSTLNTDEENNAIWYAHRSFVHKVPYGLQASLYSQSLYIDMKPYVEAYRDQVNAHERDVDLTPELIASGEDVAQFLESFSDRKTRENKYYIICRVNPEQVENENQMRTGHYQLDAAIGKVGNATGITGEEAYEDAQGRLDEIVNIAHGEFSKMGCRLLRLNKEGIYQFVYQFFNREVSAEVNLVNLRKAGVFDENKISVTPSQGANFKPYNPQHEVTTP